MPSTRERSIHVSTGEDAVTFPNVVSIRIMGPEMDLSGRRIGDDPTRIYWQFWLERPGQWRASGGHCNGTWGDGFVIDHINNRADDCVVVVDTFESH
jgi:hypothetical protein